MKKYIISIIFFLTIITIYSNKSIGISRIYYDNPVYNRYILMLEDEIFAATVDLPGNEFSALNIKYDLFEFKKIIETWKKDDSILNEVNELISLDYCIVFQVKSLNIYKEKDFYDRRKFNEIFEIDLRILIVDCDEKVIVDEDMIEVKYSTENDRDFLIKESISHIIKRYKSYLNDLIIFKLKINPLEVKPLIIKLDKGRNDGIRPQNILVSYEEDEYTVQEHTVIKVIKSDEKTSIGMILYTKGGLTEDYFFTKSRNINLELQLGGGFSLSDKENNIQTAGDYVSVLPYATVRLFIPVGVTFFRPGFNVEFNFFYIDNKLVIPISFETGCQAEIFIHRFKIYTGFMIGALFSPNLDNNYELDTVVIRPYLHLTGVVNRTVDLFGEVGYRYYVKGKFYNNWQIDMSGVYFNFGIGINL